jgi:hypothetical protein
MERLAAQFADEIDPVSGAASRVGVDQGGEHHLAVAPPTPHQTPGAGASVFQQAGPHQMIRREHGAFFDVPARAPRSPAAAWATRVFFLRFKIIGAAVLATLGAVGLRRMPTTGSSAGLSRSRPRCPR